MALEIARAGAGNSSARLVVLAFHGDDVRNVVKGRMHYLATVDGLAETMALKFGGVHNVASVALRPKEGDPWKRGKALKEAARHVAQLSPGVPRHLVAFSRGAVALSACCSDLAEDPSARGALGGPVKGVHYIDAGVSPGPGAHPEYGAAIKIGEFLKEYGAIARVEGTPRQVCAYKTFLIFIY